jgi:hypothetical protein
MARVHLSVPRSRRPVSEMFHDESLELEFASIGKEIPFGVASDAPTRRGSDTEESIVQPTTSLRHKTKKKRNVLIEDGSQVFSEPSLSLTVDDLQKDYVNLLPASGIPAHSPLYRSVSAYSPRATVSKVQKAENVQSSKAKWTSSSLREEVLGGFEIEYHPMVWLDRIKTKQEDDFLFTFLRRHDLFLKDFDQLNQGKQEKLPPQRRIDPSIISVVGNKTTGIPYIKSGTVGGLFEVMIDAVARKSNHFPSIEMTLFLTFPLYTTQKAILTYFIEAIKTNQEHNTDHITETLHHWVGLIPEDFDNENEDEAHPNQTNIANDLLKAVNEILTQMKNQIIFPVTVSERNARMIKEMTRFESPPPSLLPHLPKGTTSLSFIHIDPLEIARQITIVAFAGFEGINLRDWLMPASESDGITKLSQDFNYFSSFLVEQILEPEDASTRADIIFRCVSLANHLLQLRNFHHFMAVVCALSSAPISRLRKTWKAFHKNKEMSLKYFDQCQIGAMENNFQNLREVSHLSADTPMLPYLGLCLSDLTFITDGNK